MLDFLQIVLFISEMLDQKPNLLKITKVHMYPNYKLAYEA